MRGRASRLTVLLPMKLALLCAERSITEVRAMLSDETRRKLREMQMDALVEAFDEQEKNIATYAEFSFEKRITFAVDQCYAAKNMARVKRLLKSAKLRFPDADINTLCYKARDLNQDQILSLATGSYFAKATNIVINGPTGSGKTYLSCALGKEACRHLYRTRYYRMPEMLEILNLAEHKGQGISRAVTKLANYHLLILDEWLLDVPSERECKYLLEIFEKRYDKWPTIFCSQYKQGEWYARLGGNAIAEAVIDRIVHNCAVIYSGDVNMREHTLSNTM